MTTSEFILVVLSALVLVPIAVFCLECLLSVILRPLKTRRFEPDSATRTAVLIPAHNEEAVIAATLRTLMPTLGEHDRVIVIADNCTDNTAAVARECGASVIERQDIERRGKPYALQFGIAHLQQDPPDVVAFLDADCRVDEETIPQLAAAVKSSNRPVQGLNLCHADSSDGSVSVVSELGFRFKNLVRPLGFSRLGLPCHLMGTGMAIPWQLLQQVEFAGDQLAEDMQLGIELANLGKPTMFHPTARVTSPLPTGKTAFISQRTRWEQGHLRTALANVPQLLVNGLLKLRPSLMFLAIDLTVPPLSLLVMVWGLAFAGGIAAGLLGAGWLPAMLLGIGGAAMALTIFCGWAVFCRKQVPLRSLLAIPGYVLRKVPIYLKFFTGKRQTRWIRTSRATKAE